jgi:WD40 repeat protein
MPLASLRTAPVSSTRPPRGDGLWPVLRQSVAGLCLAAACTGALWAQAPAPAQGELSVAEVEAAEAARKAEARAAAAAVKPAVVPPSLMPAAPAPAAAAKTAPPPATAASAASSASTATSAPATAAPAAPATAAAADKPLVRLPTGPTGPARALVFVGPAQVLAMAADKQVQLWAPGRQLNLGSLWSHGDVVTALAVSPGGRQLASVSADGQLRLGSTQGDTAGQAASTGVVFPNALAYSADSRLLAVGGLQATAVFNLSTGQGLHVLPGGCNGALQFSPDGQSLAVRGTAGWRLWSMDQGKPLGSLVADAQGVPLALSPSLAQAVRSDGRHLSLVNVADGSVVARTPSPGVTRAVFSADGAHVAWVQADGRALRWQLQGGVPQLLEPAVAPPAATPGDLPPALAFSTDGALLAAAGADEVLRVWDGQGRPQGRLTATGQAMHSLVFAADGGALALALTDGSTALLDTTAGQLQALRARAGAQAGPASGPAAAVNVLTPGRWVAFSPDGRTLATAGGGQLRLFNRATGQAQVTLGAAQALDIRYSRDGAWLFVLEDKQLQVWDVALRYKLQTLPLAFDLQNNLALALDAGGQNLLLWADGGQPRRVMFEARSITHQGLGAPQRRPVPGMPAVLTADQGWAGAISPDGKLLALVAGEGAAEGEVRLLDMADGRELMRLQGPVPALSTLQFTPDNRTLLAWGAGVGSNEVLRWAVPGGQPLPALDGHRGRVLNVAATADGRWLASLSDDRTVRLWNAASGQGTAVLKLLGEAGWAAVDGSGGFDASSPEAEGALVLDTGPGIADSKALGPSRDAHRRPGLLKRALLTAP